MTSKIPEKVKSKIISEYINTKKPIKSIAKINGIQYEDVIEILQEYRDLETDELVRKKYKAEYFQMYEISDEEIYVLKEKGLSYERIAEYFTKNGKAVSSEAIRERCKKIYEDKGEEEPKAVSKNRVQITDEEIFELREKGLSYVRIAEVFTNGGRKINKDTIRLRCKEIYEKYGKKEPETERKKTIQVSNQEIYELRQKGLSYGQISKFFMEQGMEITREAVQQRYRTMSKKLSIISESIEGKTTTRDENFLREQILKLKETKGATDKQITEIAKIYGIDLTLSDKENEER